MTALVGNEASSRILLLNRQLFLFHFLPLQLRRAFTVASQRLLPWSTVWSIISPRGSSSSHSDAGFLTRYKAARCMCCARTINKSTRPRPTIYLNKPIRTPQNDGVGSWLVHEAILCYAQLLAAGVPAPLWSQATAPESPLAVADSYFTERKRATSSE